MPKLEPNRAEALAFYKAALVTALHVDRETSPRLFDADADATWRAIGSDLPTVVRLDLALKNLASLYPAAFAPGPLFDVPGWHDDEPWGATFPRPPHLELEALFAAARGRAATAAPSLLAPAAPPWRAALDQVAAAWDLAPLPASAPAFASTLTPASQILVAGTRALQATALALHHRPNHQTRTQILLVADAPAPRQLLGVACALAHESGLPRFIASADTPADAVKAAGATGAPPATLLALSADATPAERVTALALANHWRVSARHDV